MTEFSDPLITAAVKKLQLSLHQTDEGKFSIKYVTLDDLKYIVPLFEAYRVFYKKTPNYEEEYAFIKERLERKESVIFLAFEEKDGNIIPLGFTQLYPSFSSTRMKRLWILNDLYVDDKYRKKGVANSLMNVAKELAIETKACELELSTQVENTRAQALYTKQGYVKTTEYFTFAYELKQ